MANEKVRRPAGQGGKLGHSNMTHWTYTEEIKKSYKKYKRREGKKLIRKELRDLNENTGS